MSESFFVHGQHGQTQCLIGRIGLNRLIRDRLSKIAREREEQALSHARILTLARHALGSEHAHVLAGDELGIVGRQPKSLRPATSTGDVNELASVRRTLLGRKRPAEQARKRYTARRISALLKRHRIHANASYASRTAMVWHGGRCRAFLQRRR